MKIFEYFDYVIYLHDFIEKNNEWGIQSQMAKAMGCQSAYLSQVLKYKGQLTEDQAFKLTIFLELKENEAEYFLLLVRESKASSLELRTFLEKKREQIKVKEHRLESKVDDGLLIDSEKYLPEYFSSSLPSLIHVATSSSKYQSLMQLSKRFNQSPQIVKKYLDFLVQASLVEKREDQFFFKGSSLHLSSDSFLNEIHQVNRRMQVIDSIRKSHKENVHYSCVFTLNESEFAKVKDLILETIEKSRKVISEGGSDEVYSLCLDAFKVI